jgi:predicted ArsR family transcriptional regulator
LIAAATALPITQISNQFDISRQGVTKHIKTLANADLVQISSAGRERYCKADAQPLAEMTAILLTILE